jgi:hypothetical protein
MDTAQGHETGRGQRKPKMTCVHESQPQMMGQRELWGRSSSGTADGRSEGRKFMCGLTSCQVLHTCLPGHTQIHKDACLDIHTDVHTIHA